MFLNPLMRLGTQTHRSGPSEDGDRGRPWRSSTQMQRQDEEIIKLPVVRQSLVGGVMCNIFSGVVSSGACG